MAIKRITGCISRKYSDTGQIKLYVEWIDTHGHTGRTEGDVESVHMWQLIKRGEREGVKLRREVW